MTNGNNLERPPPVGVIRPGQGREAPGRVRYGRQGLVRARQAGKRRHGLEGSLRAGQGRSGPARAGQGRSGLVGAGQGRSGPAGAGQGRPGPVNVFYGVKNM